MDLSGYEVAPLEWREERYYVGGMPEYASRIKYAASFVVGETAVRWGSSKSEYFYDCHYEIYENIDSSKKSRGFYVKCTDGYYYNRYIPKPKDKESEIKMHSSLQKAKQAAQKDYEKKVIKQLLARRKHESTNCT